MHGSERSAVAAGGMHELLGLYRSSTSVKKIPNNSNPINLASILPFLVKNLASIWLIWCSLAGIASGMLCTSVPSSIRGA